MIAVLMSTYNGARYLREQIESIFKQTENNWKLYVRDDGSKDNTMDILVEYSKHYPEKVFIINDVVGNLRTGASFMHLLDVVNADYYMFCDQDDVWMVNKIELTLKKMQSLENKYGKYKPIGVFTDLTVVNSNLEVVYPSLWRADNRHPEYTRDFYVQWSSRHASYGCTQMINDAAKKCVLPYKQFPGVMGAHDNWVAYILIHNGIYDYITDSTIYYRQHSTNVVGARIGINQKSEVVDLLCHPNVLFKKLKIDYARSQMLPFKVSYLKILLYRTILSINSIIKNI